MLILDSIGDNSNTLGALTLLLLFLLTHTQGSWLTHMFCNWGCEFLAHILGCICWSHETLVECANFKKILPLILQGALNRKPL